MSYINILPSSIYNKIAAGEVVERPASVVKELVENSIDAGAGNIGIYIKGGGSDCIAIVDDGHGILHDEVATAFLPHSTSKISKAEDLTEIKTLGFRGEALASIAAVSQITMWTKSDSEDLGTKLSISGGEVLTNEYVAGGVCGTKIEVSKLFYNVPARKKFLKRPSSETAEITNVVSRLILANPYISFKYVVDNQDIFYTGGKGLDEAIFVLYGKKCLENSFLVENEYKDVSVYGYVAEASFLKPNTTFQTVIVNGRYVNNDIVALAVKNAFSGLTMQREYPVFAISVILPSDTIDVNVHPNKLEVRYANKNDVYRAVYHPIKKHLVEKRLEMTADYVINTSVTDLSQMLGLQQNIDDVVVPPLTTSKAEEKKENDEKTKEQGNNFGNLTQIKVEQVPFAPKYEFDKISDYPFNTPPNPSVVDVHYLAGYQVNYNVPDENDLEESIKLENQDGAPPISEDDIGFEVLTTVADGIAKNEKEISTIDNGHDVTFSSCKTIGSMFNCYILAVNKQKNALLILDQHAAHERILYDKYIYKIKQGPVAMTQCFVPYEFNATDSQLEFFEAIKDRLFAYGFDIDINEKDKLVVRGWPQSFTHCDLNYFLNSILADNEYDFDINNINKFYIAKKACRAAIKGGQEITMVDIKYIFRCLDENKNLKCPHGRPIAVAIKKSAFDKLFKRIV